MPRRQVPRRSPFTAEGRAALLHAVAHIEFNAINLALDAVWRFAGMPADYYRDWLQVAAEEALHFTLLREHLRTLGHDYGDFDGARRPVGDGERTSATCSRAWRWCRARSRRAGSTRRRRCRPSCARAGDLRAVEILDIILRDEIGHVAIGNRWYRWLCERTGSIRSRTTVLAERYAAPRPRPPFNLEARRAAGFSEAELDWLNG